MMLFHIIFFLIVFFVTYFSTIIAKNVAPYIGAIDNPGDSKIHHKPIARLGGLAVYIAFVISIIIVNYWNRKCFFVDSSKIIGLFIGGNIVFVIGLFDDILTLKASYKLFFQALAASILFIYGIKMNFFPNLWISYFFTVVYVVGTYSAMDMIDGMDGLAAGIIFICSIFFLVIFWQQKGLLGTFLSLFLISSSLGFLGHNYYPAKIFMGDGGSMLFGFLLASLMVLYTDKPYNILRFIIPILILMVPILDNLLTFIYRYKQGKSFLVGDLNHFYNHILDCGYSYQKTVLIMYLFSLIFGISALLLTVHFISGIAFTVLSGGIFFYFNKKIQIIREKTN